MSFIYFPQIRKTSNGEGGEGGGGIDAPVKSVNGKTGHVFLTFRDLNAVQNLQKSVGGIMAGRMRDLPRTPEPNTLFISTDRYPNSLYIYNNNKWERIGGEEDDTIEAVAVTFNNNGTSTNSENVQDALKDAFYQIKINKNDFIIEIDKINQEIGKLAKEDGKVKLTEYDRLDFLENKLDKNTINVEGNLLTVKGINGLFATLEELNYLSGARDNIQKQIDNLSKIGELAVVVDSYDDLLNLDLEENNVEVNDLIIVAKDETKDDEVTLYMLDKTKNWQYIATFDVEFEIRDFEIDPVDLTKEVINILDEKHIDSIIVRRDELEDLKNSLKINSSDDVKEGYYNKYYKDSRVDSRINNNPKIMDLESKSHTHYNKEVIDELGETPDGYLTFRGQIIGMDDGSESPVDPPTGETPPQIVDNDGRVKISSQDVLGYLGTKLDNRTIKTENNKLYANSLRGMLATVDDINKLTGIRDNIQSQLDSMDSKIKVDKYDSAGYLGEKIDRDTIVVKNNKLMANRLNGQTVSISEINFLKGLKGNIQDQLDMLSEVGAFTDVVDNKSDLENIKNPRNGDLVLVSTDEEHDNKTTFYMRKNNKWEYGGTFHIEIRNFDKDPIKLDREVTGVLANEHIDADIVRRYELDKYKIDSTSDIPEGNNKYFTNERVNRNINVKENTKQRHKHDNKEIIDELSEDLSGKLIYKGKEISVSGEIMWDEF